MSEKIREKKKLVMLCNSHNALMKYIIYFDKVIAALVIRIKKEKKLVNLVLIPHAWGLLCILVGALSFSNSNLYL